MTTATTTAMTTPTSTSPAADDDDDDYQTRLLQAGDPLASVLHIFDRFNHRHRNQHRVAKWWVQFARLRRALRRLDHAILSHRRRLRTASVARPAPARPARPRRVPSPLGASESAVAAHARWLASHAVPPAYLAFTQLAADRQHAPLGLLLVALTARLDALLAPLNPTPTPPLPPQTQPPLLHGGGAAAAAASAAAPSLPAHHPDHIDLGVAVSRSAVRPDDGNDHDDDHDDHDDNGASIPTPGAQQTAPRITPSTSEPAPDTKSQSKVRPKAKAKALASKPPKKKRPKGDEFADLFSSLL